MKRLLIQTQLSNYDSRGKWILECDSEWQMVMGRVREMLKLNRDLHIDVMCPDREQLITQPEDVNRDLWDLYGSDSSLGRGKGVKRLQFVHHHIIPNALVTRYDFNWTG